MKKKTNAGTDISVLMTQIQEQLAVLDRKLDAFMTKSLNELAQALAASKPAPVGHGAGSSNQPTRAAEHRPARPMYAVVCFECGKDTEIPFKPSGDRPVFCQECFSKRKMQQAGKSPESHKPNTSVSLQPKNTTVSVTVPSTSAEGSIKTTPSKVKKKAPAKKSSAVKKSTATKKSKKK